MPIQGGSPERRLFLEAARDNRWLDAYLFAAGRGAIDQALAAGRTQVSGGRHRGRQAITAQYARSLTRLAV